MRSVQLVVWYNRRSSRRSTPLGNPKLDGTREKHSDADVGKTMKLATFVGISATNVEGDCFGGARAIGWIRSGWRHTSLFRPDDYVAGARNRALMGAAFEQVGVMADLPDRREPTRVLVIDDEPAVARLFAAAL